MIACGFNSWSEKLLGDPKYSELLFHIWLSPTKHASYQHQIRTSDLKVYCLEHDSNVHFCLVPRMMGCYQAMTWMNNQALLQAISHRRVWEIIMKSE